LPARAAELCGAPVRGSVREARIVARRACHFAGGGQPRVEEERAAELHHVRRVGTFAEAVGVERACRRRRVGRFRDGRLGARRRAAVAGAVRRERAARSGFGARRSQTEGDADGCVTQCSGHDRENLARLRSSCRPQARTAGALSRAWHVAEARASRAAVAERAFSRAAP